MSMQNPTTRPDLLARTYAQALLELASEEGAESEIGQELEQIGQLLLRQPELRTLFEHPTIPTERRAGSLQRIFTGRVRPTTLRFLQVVGAHGRLGHFGPIAAAYEELLRRKRGEVEVALASAVPLEPKTLEQVAAAVGRVVRGRVTLQPTTDPALIGGIRLRIGDRLMDGSVAARLRRLKRRLIERGATAPNA